MNNSTPMQSIWHSLAWKEWHEHKWKLVALLAIMWGVALLPLADMERGTLFGVRVVLTIGSVPLAIFIGLGTAAGERSRGTLQFLQALPVPMWRVALYKMAFGFATIIVPALLTLALAYGWCKCLELLGIKYGAISDFHFRKGNPANPFAFGTNSWFLDSALIALLVSGSFYLWTIAFGVNRKDEVSAGAVALSAIVGWGLILTLAWYIIMRIHFSHGELSKLEWLTVTLLATVPGGLAPVSEIAVQDARLLFLGLSVAAVTHFALAAWFVSRFAQTSNLEIRSPKSAAAGARSLDWLGPPRRSHFMAIAWKQFRESGPIVLAGLAIVAGTTALFSFPQTADNDPTWRELLIPVSMTIGFCLAMVIGIGIALNDSKPGPNTFWRSRPINADLWFWIKFLSGLAILMAAIYGPLFLFVPWAAGHPAAYLYPLAHVAIFAAAVAMTCLVRHAVYAAILSIAVVYLGVAAVALALVVGRLLGWVEWPPKYLFDMTEAQAAAGLLLSFVTSTLLAWLAVRYDWGQKSRY